MNLGKAKKTSIRRSKKRDLIIINIKMNCIRLKLKNENTKRNPFKNNASILINI